MATTIGDLAFGITVDDSDLKKSFSDIKKNAKKELGKTKKVVDKGTKDVAKKAKSNFSEIGRAIRNAFAFAVILNFFKRLVTFGSDLEEQTSKFNTIFKGIEEQAQSTFDGIADATGRSRLELQKYGAELGDVLKPLGFTTEEAFKLSENITKLAVDVASFNNVSDPQAINAFRGALTGEREALKTLGIVILESDVKTEAYTSSIAKQGEELTKQQKALATYNLLLKNSADAQGDAVRTNKSFANQLKRFQGIIKDTLAKIGQNVAQRLSFVLSAISGFIEESGIAILNSVVSLGDSITQILSKTAQGFNLGIGFILTSLSGLFGRTEENAISLTEILLRLFGVIETGVKTLKLLLESLGKFAGTALSGIFEPAETNINDTLNEIIDDWKKFGDEVEKTNTGITKKIEDGQKKQTDGYSTQFNTFKDLIDKYSKDVKEKIGKGTEKAFQKARDDLKKYENGFRDLRIGTRKDLEELARNNKKAQQEIAEDNAESIKSFIKLRSEISETIEEIQKQSEEDVQSIDIDLGEAVIDQREKIKELEKEITEERTEARDVSLLEEQLRKEKTALRLFLQENKDIQDEIDKAEEERQKTSFQRLVEESQSRRIQIQEQAQVEIDELNNQIEQEKILLDEFLTVNREKSNELQLLFIKQRNSIQRTQDSMRNFTENYISDFVKIGDTTEEQVARVEEQLKRFQDAFSRIKSLESSEGFAEGGYTGDGGTFQPAGTVHRGEYVVPNHMVKSMPNLISKLEGMRTGSNQSIDNSKNVTMGDVSFENQFDMMDVFKKKIYLS